MNIAVLLDHAALSFGARPALYHGAAHHADYRGFRAVAAALGAGLRAKLKLASGDRVGIAMANRPAFYEALFGIWYAGGCAVPMNAKLHVQEFAYILGNSGARICFVGPELAASFAALEKNFPGTAFIVVGEALWVDLLRDEPAPLIARPAEAPAWLFYTSGTTGRPKGATLTHRNLMLMTLSYFADMDWIATEDAIIHAAPMSHGSGLYGLPHVAKAAANVVAASGSFDPGEIYDLLPRYPGASLFMAPTMVVRMMNHPACAKADLTNLKSIYYGGGPMYVADIERAITLFGPRLIQLYAQGEAPMTVTYLSKAQHQDFNHPRYRARLGSTGLMRTGVEVRVIGEDERVLPVDVEGEVCVRGDIVMAGYWESPEANESALKGGWLHTGDIGSLDADGFLTLKDRSKDMIISGGSNIYPREIEEVLLRHPAVLEAAVVGKPHPEWGEEVIAFIVAHPGQSVMAEALDRLCLDHIARYKRPRRYRFVEHLPKNNYGKVLKRELRAQLSTER